ncbi:MAG: hypothetical protein LC658_03375, partial [Bacteroidales bacterium]|nr:hypothetical protein [Bacteroidales bacterium]
MSHVKRFVFPFFLLLIALFFKYFIEKYDLVDADFFDTFNILGSILLIVALAWGLIVVLRISKWVFLEKYDTSKEDNLRSRKFHTQFNILERIIIFLIVIISIGLILMLFEDV